jgi:hypothetical protein
MGMMKHKIKFTLLLFIAIAALMFNCNQSTNKALNGNDINLECTKLDEIREKIDLKTKSMCDSIIYISERYNSLVGDYKGTTFDVKQRTDELLYFIQSLKIEIVKAVEGEGSPAINGEEINAAKINSLNNNKVPSEILIGKDENGKAFVLKALLQDYKEHLFEAVKNDSLITKSISNYLNTDNQKKSIQGKNIEETETWENYFFQAQPVGLVVITLTQMQNNVKNAESEVLSFIQNKINAEVKLNN